MLLSKEEKNRAEYLLYNEKVRKLTECTFRNEFVDDGNLRGKEYHLDHKLSVRECFENDVPPEMAAHICNLEIISSDDNLKKGSKSTITYAELIEDIADFESHFLD